MQLLARVAHAADDAGTAAALVAIAERRVDPWLSPIDLLDTMVIRYGFEVAGDVLRPWLER